MTEPQIRIEQIKVKDLISFARKVVANAREGQFVPITIQRAEAHAHNPYADAEDIALLAAIDADEEVVGYFGIMPMLLRRGDDLFKTDWFTTWAVSPKVRGQGVGSRLMQAALTLDKDFLIVGSVHARRVSKKYGFWERDPLVYYWIDVSGMGQLNPLTWLLRLVRKTFHLLGISKPVKTTNAAVRWIDRFFAPLTRRIFYARLGRFSASILADCHYREVTQLREESSLQENRPEVELHRGPEAVNWMLAYPWVLKSGESPTEKMDYYFTDARPLFRFIALEVFGPDDQGYKGYAVFSVSQKPGGVMLKILDFRFTDSSFTRQVLALALHYGKQYQADTIEIPAEVATHLKGWLGRLLLQRRERIYQSMPKSDGSPLAQSWHDITLHLYDGDMPFS